MSTWQAGKDAADALCRIFQISDDARERDLTIQELDAALPDLMQQVESFLDETFYPDFTAELQTGRIGVSVSLELFQSFWQDYSLVSKAEIFLDLVGAAPLDLHDANVDRLPQKIAAVATLKQIDDCVLSVLDGGACDGEEMLRVERMRRFVAPHRPSGIDFGAMKRQALSELNTNLARRRHKKTNDAREWIKSEWTACAGDYQNNKSAFSRHYVRLLMIERGVEITEKQMKEVWLKDTPSARKPDGLPADG